MLQVDEDSTTVTAASSEPSVFSPTRQSQYFYGLRDKDDVILRRVRTKAPPPGGGAAGWGSWQGSERRYYLTDSHFSVVATTDSYGQVKERSEYDDYGNARPFLVGDLNGDGLVDDGDFVSFYAAYDVLECSATTPIPMPFGDRGGACPADLNEDGLVDDTDFNLFVASYNKLLPEDESGPRYAGYWYDANISFFSCRQRWYDPQAGRWLTRDPAGYVDGMSLYLYVKGNPWSGRDPTGLSAVGDWARNMYEGAKSIAQLDPGGARTTAERWSMEDHQAHVQRNSNDKNAYANIDVDIAIRTQNARDFGRRAGEVGTAIDTTVRVAAQTGDAVNTLVNSTGEFIKQPSAGTAAGIAIGLFGILTVGPDTPTAPLAQTEAKLGKYEVGSYSALRKEAEAGLDAHHVGQKAVMKDLVSGYDANSAPAILVPKEGHTIGEGVLSRNTTDINNARDLVARDTKELRRVYPDIPNKKLQSLINANKQMYPEMGKK